MTRQVFWYNLFHTPVPYLFHTLWNKGSVPYPMEQEGARCSPETWVFDARRTPTSHHTNIISNHLHPWNQKDVGIDSNRHSAMACHVNMSYHV